MGGTSEGAEKAVATNLAKDPDHYGKISRQARAPRGGYDSANGFDKDPERARQAGAKGGRASKRGKARK